MSTFCGEIVLVDIFSPQLLDESTIVYLLLHTDTRIAIYTYIHTYSGGAYTVESLNKGHFRTSHFGLLYEGCPSMYYSATPL